VVHKEKGCVVVVDGVEMVEVGKKLNLILRDLFLLEE